MAPPLALVTDDFGAAFFADAAALVALEEAMAHHTLGAHRAVAAPPERHPLRGAGAGGAAVDGLKLINVDDVGAVRGAWLLRHHRTLNSGLIEGLALICPACEEGAVCVYIVGLR
jgi:hypothetical protein